MMICFDLKKKKNLPRPNQYVFNSVNMSSANNIGGRKVQKFKTDKRGTDETDSPEHFL